MNSTNGNSGVFESKKAITSNNQIYMWYRYHCTLATKTKLEIMPKYNIIVLVQDMLELIALLKEYTSNRIKKTAEMMVMGKIVILCWQCPGMRID